MANHVDLSDVRREYESQSIGEQDLDADPILQFKAWLQQARDFDLLDATAMTLATATPDGRPSARMVLLKRVDENGFYWYSDARSQKGRELAQNPRATLLFHWRDLSRQVRVQGTVTPLPAENAESYFQSRPEGSRFSAAASKQSSVIANRTQLQDEVRRLRAAYPDGKVPRPESWIGYCLAPDHFEFWQGQDSRLHDRIVYLAEGDGWRKQRLSP